MNAFTILANICFSRFSSRKFDGILLSLRQVIIADI
jgi:hypothetical protein